MNKLYLLLYYCFILSFICSDGHLYAKQKSTNIGEITNGINSISKAFGDTALMFKKTYDQIDPDAINTKNTLINSDTKTKTLEEKLQAIIDSVKQWMITDSNTKREALQALQRNTDVIGGEVEKAKRRLETANNAANKVPMAEKSKFNNEIQASANAVNANTQYYLATKTRLDYETKYKELIDERTKRLDMIKKINDPSIVREILSDSTNISSKKYGEQLGEYTNADVKQSGNLPQQPPQHLNNTRQDMSIIQPNVQHSSTVNGSDVTLASSQDITKNNASILPQNNNPQHWKVANITEPVWHSANDLKPPQLSNRDQVLDAVKTPIMQSQNTKESNTTQQHILSLQQMPGLPQQASQIGIPQQETIPTLTSNKQQIKYTNSETTKSTNDAAKTENINVVQTQIPSQTTAQQASISQILNPAGITSSRIPITTVPPSTFNTSPIISLPTAQPGILATSQLPTPNVKTSATAKNTPVTTIQPVKKKISLAGLLAPISSDEKKRVSTGF